MSQLKMDNNIFSNKNQILSLVMASDNYHETQRLTNRFHLLKEKRPEFYLTLEDLQEIFEWKLRLQIGRQEKTRQANTNANIVAITKAAFGVRHDDSAFQTKLKLKLLCAISGVQIPVASAILTLCFPTEYSVIDVRNWRKLYGAKTNYSSYSGNEYIAYLEKMRNWAAEYNVTTQELDIAIWQSDIEERKRKETFQKV